MATRKKTTTKKKTAPRKRAAAKQTKAATVDTVAKALVASVASKPKKKSAAKAKKARKSGALDAAAKVLGEAKKPLTTKEMIDAMAAKGYWKSPGGKTPDRTLYSAILREIVTKGKDTRFKKTERGKFTLARRA